MALINYPLKEMTIKIVYYGPGLSGKTTSLKYIYENLPEKKKGKIVTLSTEGDRTFFFDFLPITTGKIGNFNTRIQLYTVPGQVFYENTRRMVLQGTDGAIFVADSQEVAMDANKESLNSLYKNLKVNNIDIDSIPIIMAYNKRDLSNVLSISELNKELNPNNYPYFETSALTGQGIMETLEETIKLTLKSVRKRYKFQATEERDETVVFDKNALMEEEQRLNMVGGIDSIDSVEDSDKEALHEEATIEMEEVEEIDPIEEGVDLNVDDITLEEYNEKYSNDSEEENIDLLNDEENPIPLNDITELSDKFAEESDTFFEENLEKDDTLYSNSDSSEEMFGGGESKLEEIIKVSLGKDIKVKKQQIIIPLNIKINDIIKKVNIKLDIKVEED
jgi:signal recognition particle receptor subunit beta